MSSTAKRWLPHKLKAAQLGIAGRMLDRWVATGRIERPRIINHRKFYDEAAQPQLDPAPQEARGRQRLARPAPRRRAGARCRARRRSRGTRSAGGSDDGGGGDGDGPPGPHTTGRHLFLRGRP